MCDGTGGAAGQGIGSSRTRDPALRRVTFYAYFPSRTDLMRAVIGEFNEALERIASPTRGSTERALVAAVSDGSRGKITEWLRTTSSRWDTIRPYLNAALAGRERGSELRRLVDAWMEEGISDVEEGLGQAGRFAPETRHYRGVLAMSQLDFVARNWRPGRWNTGRDQMIEILAES